MLGGSRSKQPADSFWAEEGEGPGLGLGLEPGAGGGGLPGGGSSGETAVTLPSPGGLKHLTGDGSESTWLRHGKPVFSMQTSTPPPPPSNACNSHPRLGEESGGAIFLMLAAGGNWASDGKEEGDLWRSLPTTSLARGGGTWICIFSSW